MSLCSSCNRPVEWVRTTLGRPMPLDPEYLTVLPDRDGDTVITTDGGETLRGVRVEASIPGAVRGRISHFATCPSVEKHRRAKR